MNKQVELERYWHWFHGLFGISQKEKERLLNICPKQMLADLPKIPASIVRIAVHIIIISHSSFPIVDG